MARHEQYFQMIKTIAYSRLVTNTFSVGECISMQQWANLGIEPDIQIIQKYARLNIEMNNRRWEKPELKYTEDKLLLYLDTETLTWKKVTIN